jgi:hypothetical protein
MSVLWADRIIVNTVLRKLASLKAVDAAPGRRYKGGSITARWPKH